MSPEHLNFAYQIEGDRVPWRPVQAFDDGTRTSTSRCPRRWRSPRRRRSSSSGGRDQALVNYRVRGRYYVVDKLFSEAALVLGVGGEQQRVTVRRERQPRARRR